MQKDQFIRYMSNPEELDEKSLENLREILADYPYFQTAHLLLVKNLSKLNHMKFDNQLRISAAHVGNRQVLFRLLAKDSMLTEANYSIGEKQETPAESEPVRQEKLHEFASGENTKEKSYADIVLEQVSVMNKEMDEKYRKREDVLPVQGDVTSSEGIFEIDEKQDITVDEEVFSEFTSAAKTTPDLLLIDEQKEPDSAEKSKDKIPAQGTEAKEPVNPAQKKTSVENKSHQREVHSFTSWLSIFREDDTTSSTQGDNNYLIDAFITRQPRIERKTVDEPGGAHVDISMHSVIESDDFITETLAKIYVKQKKYDKAISIYEKLSLKYPEKISYFAVQIDEIKKLLTNNS